MRVVIACDSYKGSLSSQEIAESMSEGIRRVCPDADIDTVLMGDGGEGTMDAFLSLYHGQRYTQQVTGPLGTPVMADYAVLEDGTAFIEMAAASGLTLVPVEQRDPSRTTTRGTGELIRAAMDRGCKRIILGIGGSATNDGGAGMARALGVRFLDASGEELPDGGGALANLDSIDLTGLDPRLQDTRITVACDVDNPLCGEHGASAVYGPQKGATPAMVCMLDDNLRHYADIAEQAAGRKVRDLPGAGAAGGLGAGVMLFAEAALHSGIEVVLDLAHFDERIRTADLVLTGEGRIDGQSIRGKVPVGVARKVKAQADIPVIAVVGGIGPGAEAVYQAGVDSIVSIAPGPITLQDAMHNAAPLLADTAERIMRLYCAVKKSP